MAEYSAVAVQTVAANQNVLFTGGTGRQRTYQSSWTSEKFKLWVQ